MACLSFNYLINKLILTLISNKRSHSLKAATGFLYATLQCLYWSAGRQPIDSPGVLISSQPTESLPDSSSANPQRTTTGTELTLVFYIVLPPNKARMILNRVESVYAFKFSSVKNFAAFWAINSSSLFFAPALPLIPSPCSAAFLYH